MRSSDTRADTGKGSPSPRQRGLLTLLCCLAMFLYAVYFGAISVLLPSLGSAFGLGPAVQGALFPAQFGGFIPGVLLSGYLSDRFGRKGVLLVGIGAYALGLLLFAIAPRFSVALVASALIGGGSGAMETVVSVLIADLFPKRRAFAVNALQVVFGVGAAGGPYLAQYLLAGGIEWRSLYLGFALANAALLVLLTPIPIRVASASDESIDFLALLRILRQPTYLALCLAQALYVGGEVAYASWMPTYIRQLPEGKIWEGVVVTIFWIAMTIGRSVISPLSQRLPLMKLTIALAAVSAFFAALTVVASTPLWIMACVVCVGFCFSGIFGLILAEAGERYPSVAGSAFGGIMASGGSGGAGLPYLVGVVAATPLGWKGGLLLVPAAALGIAVLCTLIQQEKKR